MRIFFPGHEIPEFALSFQPLNLQGLPPPCLQICRVCSLLKIFLNTLPQDLPFVSSTEKSVRTFATA